MINSVHFLFRLLRQLICLEISCRYKEKGTRKTGRRNDLSWLCMGLGKFQNWKPFLKSESHWKDFWLPWDGRRKGREQRSKWLCLFLSTEGTQSKASALWHWSLLFSPEGHRAQGTGQHHAVRSPASGSVILFYPWPHSQMFYPMLSQIF